MATEMTLILSNDDVEKLLTMPECIDVMEEAYVELAEGRGISRTRSDCITPTTRPDAVYGLKSMDGVIPKFGIGAVRINSDIVTFPKRGNNIRREKVPAAPNGWERTARCAPTTETDATATTHVKKVRMPFPTYSAALPTSNTQWRSSRASWRVALSEHRNRAAWELGTVVMDEHGVVCDDRRSARRRER